MCLILTVAAPSGEREELEDAAGKAAAAGLRVEMEHSPRWPWARQSPARAVISEQGGCACSLLSHDADWNADAWAMRPEIFLNNSPERCRFSLTKARRTCLLKLCGSVKLPVKRPG